MLLVYYMFPPMVGGWRAIGSIVRHLPALDWQAVVLSAAETVGYPKDYSLLAEVPAGLDVHRVGHRERPREVQALLNRLRVNIDFPDSFRRWYRPALQEGRRILRRQPVDVLFSYGPPYTSHFVAAQLKREFGLPWVMDMADLWAGNQFLFNARTLIRPLRLFQEWRARRAERRLLRTADRLMVVSWYHRRRLGEMYGLAEDEIVVMNHGYDEPDFSGLQPRALYPDRPTVTFLGTFYPQFDESFRRFLAAMAEVASDGEVVLVGRGGEHLQGPNLTRIQYLPKGKALAFCAGSDFLLVVMPPGADWIPMKIYDYLRLGKPILALVPEAGDVARIVRDARAGFVLSHEMETLKGQLQDILARWRRGELRDWSPDPQYVANLERAQVTRRIVEVLEQVCS